MVGEANACKIAVVSLNEEDLTACTELAARLGISLITPDSYAQDEAFAFYLSWQSGCLSLFDQPNVNKKGLKVDFDVRHEQQRSWPAPKKGPLAQAIGRKTRTVVDATCGWGQDSFFIFRMGYQLTCLERSQVMFELLQDGFRRLSRQDWFEHLQLQLPELQQGNAIIGLTGLKSTPDCIYLDPMFPPKRKKSALAKKPMMVLRDILGDDPDRQDLFESAMAKAGNRVVVKSPDYAKPLGGEPSVSYTGKLVRYDVYMT